MNKHKKLNITFHNPNGERETTDFIARMMLEACRAKFEAMLRTPRESGLYNKTKENAPP